jgi:hypothetical protein
VLPCRERAAPGEKITPPARGGEDRHLVPEAAQTRRRTRDMLVHLMRL